MKKYLGLALVLCFMFHKNSKIIQINNKKANRVCGWLFCCLSLRCGKALLPQKRESDFMLFNSFNFSKCSGLSNMTHFFIHHDTAKR